MNRTVAGARRPATGTVEVPGDKSIAHRALILGTLANGDFRLANMPEGRDVLSTRQCLESLGARIDGMGREMRIEGLGLRGLQAPAQALDCGNSGTTMRLLMGVLAGQPYESRLLGDASLSQRPMKRVSEPLEKMGAGFALTDGGRPPVRVRGTHPLKPVTLRLAVPSAQVKSAVLLAGLYADGITRVTDPFGTRDHTERMLRFLSDGGIARRDGDAILVEPHLLATDKSLTIPGDISSAAFFAAIAALVPGSDLLLRGVLLNPSRLGFFAALREMGAVFQAVERGEAGGEPVGEIQINASSLTGIRLAPERIPALVDEVPLLAVVAAGARGETRIEGLAELRLKETDRLTGTVDGLRALGADARAEGDTLIVRGPARLKGASVQSRGDHRLAMAFAVAALRAAGETHIEDAGCVDVSFPGFFEELGRLCA
ncbi:MAG: 3-phosphoshikimate 1-carboxyvinyltransferase [Elusimicrobiota bacterium]